MRFNKTLAWGLVVVVLLVAVSVWIFFKESGGGSSSNYSAKLVSVALPGATAANNGSGIVGAGNDQPATALVPGNNPIAATGSANNEHLQKALGALKRAQTYYSAPSSGGSSTENSRVTVGLEEAKFDVTLAMDSAAGWATPE